jgi:hypothetical protein
MNRDRMRIRALAGEPLVHFLLIGVVLFAAYQWRARGDSSRHRIVITEGVVADLVAQHVAAKGREPGAGELTHLLDAYVRDEILYREGVALGLDRDDIVVKRRVRQKLEVIGEEDASTGAPTDADLAAYLAAHRERFTQPAVLTFEQVFLGHAPSSAETLRAVALRREAGGDRFDPRRLGHPSLLPARVALAPADLVAREFGASFAEAAEKAPIGEWVGPIHSSFGTHYVRVSDRTPAVDPSLGAVREQVVREWENDRRRRARDDAFARMRRAYTVSIEARPPADRP